MRAILQVLIVSLTFLATVAASATTVNSSGVEFEEFGEFYQLRSGAKVWVEGEVFNRNAPTKLIFNGLTNSATFSFIPISREFRNRGYNVVRFDMFGQAKTLMANPMPGPRLDYRDQVAMVRELIPSFIKTLGLRGPIDALGQSYGGGIMIALSAMHPQFVDKTFRSFTAFAPYTEPLATQHEQILRLVKIWKDVPPYNDMTEERVYEIFFKYLVQSTYGYYEPEVLGVNPMDWSKYLSGVSSLALGIQPFQAGEVTGQMANIRLNVIIAATDQYIPSDVIPRFWEKVPQAKRGLFIEVYGTEHKMLQFIPSIAADLSEVSAYPHTPFKANADIEMYVLSGRLHADKEKFKLSDLAETYSRHNSSFSTPVSGTVLDFGGSNAAQAFLKAQ